ncbi:GNAT family N-acetyltransferase [Undibacterium sp. TJN19]|uniref:GNAT family N-acetyltransferase n=1 Tax=Undibacterium sp. TJN19 TaxID=3413055 RepID=UPI003BF022DE
MTTFWKIRPVTADDLFIITHHRYHLEIEQQEDFNAYARWLEDVLVAGKYVGLLAEADGEVIAGAGMTILEWGPTRGDTHSHRGRIVNVYTAPGWRMQGIAKALVSGLIQLGEARGLKTFSLSASDKGKSLYQDLGFVSYSTEMLRKVRIPDT